MLKNIGHFIVYTFLISLLLLASTPHDFIHDFTGHKDTIDHIYKHDGHREFAFENGHHHCSFLNFVFSVFDNSITHYECSITSSNIHFYNEFILSFFIKEGTHTSLRGPPIYLS